ncbi:hypothetical protein K1719_034690 [Acacia pycnantha]|nr:hypothetical protein K1719_034690 [Acacia pycnantha]
MDLEDQVEQLPKQLQQLKGKSKDKNPTENQGIEEVFRQRNLVIRERIPCISEPIVEDCEEYNESVAVSCIIDSGASRSCISPNAIPRHFYEEMYGQKFEMNKGKTPVKTEQGDSSEPTKEMMTFGSTVLVKYPPGHNKAIKPLPHLPTPDESQQCLLDALWDASTARQKHTTLNALNFYL